MGMPNTNPFLAYTIFHLHVPHPFHGMKGIEALKLMREGQIIMVELPNVFILIVAPTKEGCEKLEVMKKRPKGEMNFGVCIGDLEKFANVIERDSLPLAMKGGYSYFEYFEQSHMNVVVTKDKSFNSIMVRDGTLQGFLSRNGSPHRSLFRFLENGLADKAEKDIIGGKFFSSVAGTSCNYYHEGSITEWEKAYEFGLENKISLAISCKHDDNRERDVGSYSIFKIRHNSIAALRRGPIYRNIVKNPKMKEILVSFAKETIERLGLLDAKEMTINDFYDVFQEIDFKNTGWLDRSELKRFLGFLSSDTTLEEKEVDTLFSAIDVSGDGQISFPEFFSFLEHGYEGKSDPMKHLESKFVKVMQGRVNRVMGTRDKPMTLDILIKVFKSADTNNDSSLTKDELATFLGETEAVSAIELDVLFEFMDEASNGVIDFVELFRFLEDCTEMDGDVNNMSRRHMTQKGSDTDNLTAIEEKNSSDSKRGFLSSQKTYERNTTSNLQMQSMPSMRASRPGTPYYTNSMYSIDADSLHGRLASHKRRVDAKIMHLKRDSLRSRDGEFASAVSEGKFNLEVSNQLHKFCCRFHFDIDGKHGMKVAIIDKHDARTVETWFTQQSGVLWSELMEVYQIKKESLRWGFGMGNDYNFTDFRIAKISELPLYADKPKIPLDVWIFDEGDVSNLLSRER